MPLFVLCCDLQIKDLRVTVSGYTHIHPGACELCVMPDLYPTLKYLGNILKSFPALGYELVISIRVCVHAFRGRWRGILNKDTHIEIEHRHI